jgi:superfamily II RNA helicase
VADLGTQSDRLTTQISVETVKDCVHEVAVPPGYDYVPMSETRLPDKMAKEYKFVLDPFQKQVSPTLGGPLRTSRCVAGTACGRTE